MHVISYCFNAVTGGLSKLATVGWVNTVCRSEDRGIHALNEEEDYSPITEAQLFLKFHKMFQAALCHCVREVCYSILHQRAVLDLNETASAVEILQGQVQS